MSPPSFLWQSNPLISIFFIERYHFWEFLMTFKSRKCDWFRNGYWIHRCHIFRIFCNHNENVSCCSLILFHHVFFTTNTLYHQKASCYLDSLYGNSRIVICGKIIYRVEKRYDIVRFWLHLTVKQAWFYPIKNQYKMRKKAYGTFAWFISNKFLKIKF